jgi:hypothetical protein
METTKANRAAKGGETGMNGEFYPGGTFLPNTTLGKMARGAKGGAGKQEVAPYTWEVAPAAGMVSLYRQFSALVTRDGQVNAQAAAHYGYTVETLSKMYAAWRAGIRWVAVAR